MRRAPNLPAILTVGVLALVAVGAFRSWVEAQGPSYMRQDDPVARQALQLAPLDRIDAGVTSPIAWTAPGRCAWNKGTQCLMCYRDGGGWQDICPGGGATDGGESLWIAKLGDVGYQLYPKYGPDASVVIGADANVHRSKLYVYEQARSIPNDVVVNDAGIVLYTKFTDDGGVAFVEFECNGPEPTPISGGPLKNGNFADAGATSDQALFWTSSPLPGSGTETATFANNLMGSPSGRNNGALTPECAQSTPWPLAGDFFWGFGECDRGSGNNQKILIRSGQASLTQTLDLTGARILSFRHKLVLAPGNATWRLSVLIDKLLVYSVSAKNDTARFDVDITLWDGVSIPTYSGTHNVIWVFNLVGDTWTPFGEDRRRMLVGCRDSCGNYFLGGGWPGCATRPANSVSPGIPCNDGPHIPWCNANPVTGTCVDNCSGLGGSSCQCPVAGPGYAGRCANIGGDQCSCVDLPYWQLADVRLTYGSAGNSVTCSQTGTRSRAVFRDPVPVPADGGANLGAGEIVGGTFEAAHEGTGSGFAGSAFIGLRGLVRTLVPSNFVHRVEAITADLQLSGGVVTDTPSRVVANARAIVTNVSVDRLVSNLTLLDLRAPVLGATAAVQTNLTALRIEALPSLTSSANIYAINSLHTGAHKVDGWFTVGILGADPTSTLATNGTIYYNSATNKLRCRQNSAWVDCIAAGTGTVTGTGVSPRVAYWSGTSALTSDANFVWTGTGLGLYQPSPATALHVGSGRHIRMDGIAGDPGTPTTGDLFYNTNRASYRFVEVLGIQDAVGLLCVTTADSSAIANTIAETGFDQPGTSCSLPGGSLKVGTTLRVRAFGRYSTAVTGSPTLTIRVQVAGVNYCEVVANTSNNTSGEHFSVECRFTVRSIGAGGTAMANGESVFNFPSGSNATALGNPSTVAVDTTIARIVSVRAQWSVADPSNTVTLQQFMLEAM